MVEDGRADFVDLVPGLCSGIVEKEWIKMKKATRVSLVVLVLIGMLVGGCAKKPVADEYTTSEPVATTEMRDEEPAGYQEEGFGEAPVTESRAIYEEADPSAQEVAEGLERVHFAFDQYTLDTDAMKTLTENAMYIKANPDLKVVIEGHTDQRGSDEYNLALGEKRAQAAKNYLVSLGIAPGRLSIISYGEELPLDSSNTEEAWAKNRRAEFKPVR